MGLVWWLLGGESLSVFGPLSCNGLWPECESFGLLCVGSTMSKQ